MKTQEEYIQEHQGFKIDEKWLVQKMKESRLSSNGIKEQGYGHFGGENGNTMDFNQRKDITSLLLEEMEELTNTIATSLCTDDERHIISSYLSKMPKMWSEKRSLIALDAWSNRIVMAALVLTLIRYGKSRLIYVSSEDTIITSPLEPSDILVIKPKNMPRIIWNAYAMRHVAIGILIYDGVVSSVNADELKLEDKYIGITGVQGFEELKLKPSCIKHIKDVLYISSQGNEQCL